MQKTYICLNMIVRNEAKNIKRLLNSVKDSIDYYVICDTGSTDDTPKIIEETMQGYDIPGEIHYHDWKNFGHNRTLALYAATLALFEKRHDCDRVLVIDADEMLEVTDPLWYTKLDKTRTYQIMKKDKSVTYPVDHLINIKHEKFVWKGPAHNYVSRVVAQRSAGLAKGVAIIRDSSNLGGKSTRFKTTEEKYLHDATLFEAELKKDPTDARSQFYLAQSYRDAKQYDKALEHYLKRANMQNTWDQERYVSFFNAGLIFETKNEIDSAIKVYQEAFDLIPSRAEAPTRLSSLLRIGSRLVKAYMVTEKAIQNAKITGGELFRITHYYDWGLLEAAYLSAFRIKKYAEAHAYINLLVDRINKKEIKVSKPLFEKFLARKQKLDKAKNEA